MKENKRKIIQIAASAPNVYALCDDGTVWGKFDGGLTHEWYQLNLIPQPEEEDETTNIA